MSQVTIYLDDESEALMKAAAQTAGLSVSRWVTDLIREKVRNEWPDSVVALVGAWPDFPSLEELRSGQPNDTSREKL